MFDEERKDRSERLLTRDSEGREIKKVKTWKPSNLTVLYVTAAMFGGFVVAEVAGALIGNSLSLLGDASAMIVDVFTYFSNMYAERVKARHGGVLDPQTRRVLEVYIPTFSVAALVGVTIYITVDAISVIKAGDSNDGDDVDVAFLYAFSCANMVVDIVSSFMFYLRGKEALSNRYMTGLRSASFSLAEHMQDSEPESGTVNQHITLPNLNMISALTHVGSDTLRTLAVFTAALVATLSNVNDNVCDATAALVVSCTIFVAVIPLCREIYHAATSEVPDDLRKLRKSEEIIAIQRL